MKTPSSPPRLMGDERSLTDLPLLLHPNLLFDSQELLVLKARRSDPCAEEILQHMVVRCDACLDPNHEDFVDWQTLRDLRWKKRAGLSLVVGPVDTAAFLYAVMGERKYAEFAKNVVFTVIRNKLADSVYQMDLKVFHTVETYQGWRRGVGHDFGNFSFTLAIFYDLCCELLSAEERKEFTAYVAENLEIALSMISEIGRQALNNRGARCAMGNAMLALAVYEEIDRELARYSIHKGLQLGEAWATYSLDIDGASFEGASYCINTSIMLACLGRACARRGLRDLSQHPNYKRLPDFLLYNLTPARDQFLPINDSFPDLPPTGALVAGTIHRNGVHRWLYEELRRKLVMHSYRRTALTHFDFLFYDPTIKPLHPREAGYPLAKHFRDRGVVSLLSGWESDAAQLIFFCGPPVYVGHRQDDQNSFTFCALGEKFAWDAGYDNLAGVYEDRKYRRSEFHNTILIDGCGQNGNDNHHWPRGHIVDFRHTDDWTYALGDASRCYGIHGVVQRVDRHVFFSRRQFPFVVIVDDVIVDEFEHDITWNFVAHPDTSLRNDAEGCWMVQGKRSAMTLRMCAPGPVAWGNDTAGKMPRLQATQRGRRACFAALFIPQWPGLSTHEIKTSFEDQAAHATVMLNGQRQTLTFDLRDRTAPAAGDERPHFTASS